MSFTWSKEQQAALDALEDFLNGPPGVFVLAGYAGTGKTTLCVEALRQQFGQICFSAPTHKAVGVLWGRGDIPGATYSTVHRLLGCRRVRKDGETAFLPDPEKSSWGENEIIVLDEVSMVGETMWGWIMDAQRRMPCHLICMGDPAQLPPVNDGDGLSPAFDTINAQLTNVQRSGGAVLAAASRIRQNMQAVDPVEVELLDGEVENVMRHEFCAKAITDFREGKDVKILAWTNKAVDFVNNHIRRAIYGPDVPDAPQPNEKRVVVTSWASDDETVMLHAGRDLTIVEAAECTYMDLPAWRIIAEGVEVALYQLRPEGEKDYRTKLADLRFDCRARKRAWREYYALDDAFIKLRAGYATTVHKSQGSTYHTAYVVDRNLKQCPDLQTRNMLRYVAFSRASHKLVLS